MTFFNTTGVRIKDNNLVKDNVVFQASTMQTPIVDGVHQPSINTVDSLNSIPASIQ